LALASTIAFTFLAVVLFILNSRALGGLGERQLAISAARAIVATLGMTVVVLGIGRVVTQPLIFLATGGVAGAVTYLLLSMVLGGKEIQHLLALVRSRQAT
jgi:peptidoglycan biosynthesis protein MviN/MurJ (putative lipid II flippase)